MVLSFVIPGAKIKLQSSAPNSQVCVDVINKDLNQGFQPSTTKSVQQEQQRVQHPFINIQKRVARVTIAIVYTKRYT